MKRRSFVLTGLFISLVILLCYAPRQSTAAQNAPDQADFSCSSVDEIPWRECKALVDLYNSTSGPEWFNNDGWLQNNRPCSWYGINCPVGYGHITHIFLDRNNLQGTIPPSLGKITLRWLDLSHNLLTGTIPKEVAGANILQLLLNNNQLTGALPVEIGSSTKLVLDISHNQLRGELPDSLGRLTDLGALFLGHNKFFGPLPGSLTNLRELHNFSFDQTGLCEPQTGGFQFWLLNIRTLYRTDIKCGEIKPWTLMYYFATDNNLADNLDHQLALLEEASGNESVNIVFFADRWDPNGSTHGAYLKELKFEFDIDEKSTGKHETLTEFVEWAQKLFPAEHYALILVDHAYGISGFGRDDHVGGDFTAGCRKGPCLTFKELKVALEPIQKLDVIYLAGCASANIEVVYELRDEMDYYVASEQIAWSPRDHGNYIQKEYVIDEKTTPKELAESMASSYMDDKVVGDTPRPLTSSVMQTSQVENAVKKTDALGMLLQNRMGTVAPTLKNVRAVVQHYSTDEDLDIDRNDVFDLVDLKDVALKIKRRVKDQDVQDAAQAVSDAVDALVVWDDFRSGSFTYEKDLCPPDGDCRWDLDNSHGVAIHWPETCSNFYREEWLDFAKGADCEQQLSYLTQDSTLTAPTGWATMLVDYVEATNPDAPLETDPPALVEPLSLLEFSHIPFIMKAYPESN